MVIASCRVACGQPGGESRRYDSRMLCAGNLSVRLLLAIVVMGLVVPAAAAVYRWTDANGQVHYAQRPPPEGGQRLELLSEKGVPAVQGDDLTQRRERQQRLLESFEYEREQRKARAAREADERQQAAQRCLVLQQRWRRLAHAGPVYIRGADGEREFLSDAQRTAEQTRMLPAYREACGQEP